MRPSVSTTVPGWLSVPVAAGVSFPAAVLGHAVGLRGHLGALPVIATAVACAVLTAPAAAAVVGVIGWAFATGFVVNTRGLLTFGEADLVLLGVAVAAALVVSFVPILTRRGRNEQSIRTSKGAAQWRMSS